MIEQVHTTTESALHTDIADGVTIDGARFNTEAVLVAEQDAALPAETITDMAEAKRALEAVLMAAAEPMPLHELKRVFDGQLDQDVLRNLLDEIKTEWLGRSVELAMVASGYRFRIRPEYQIYLNRLGNEKPLKYSRAVLETLAIIAYRQPVTRGDIEDIRGVAVSPHILKTLEDRGWVDEIGHRETVGRPVLFATTKHFLDDLNLRSLDELPPLHELQATLDMSQFAAMPGGAEMPATIPLTLTALTTLGDANTSEDGAAVQPLEVAPEIEMPQADALTEGGNALLETETDSTAPPNPQSDHKEQSQ